MCWLKINIDWRYAHRWKKSAADPMSMMTLSSGVVLSSTETVQLIYLFTQQDTIYNKKVACYDNSIGNCSISRIHAYTRTLLILRLNLCISLFDLMNIRNNHLEILLQAAKSGLLVCCDMRLFKNKIDELRFNKYDQCQRSWISCGVQIWSVLTSQEHTMLF